VVAIGVCTSVSLGKLYSTVEAASRSRLIHKIEILGIVGFEWWDTAMQLLAGSRE
jgi:hypothetical protein